MPVNQAQPELVQAVDHWQGKLALLTGCGAIYPLSQIWQVQLASKGFRIHNVDCSMRFNSYTIVDEMLRLGLKPEAMADAITVSRAFTPYQILDGLYEILEAPKDPKQLNFVLAVSKQFFDGDVQFDEGLFLLEKVQEVLVEIRKKEIPLMLVEHDSYAHPIFSTLFKKFKSISAPIWEVSAIESGSRYARPGGRVARDERAVSRPGPSTRPPGPLKHKYKIRISKSTRELNDGANRTGLFHGDGKNQGPLQKLPQRVA